MCYIIYNIFYGFIIVHLSFLALHVYILFSGDNIAYLLAEQFCGVERSVGQSSVAPLWNTDI